MFEKVKKVLNNETGLANPTIIIQLPLMVVIGSISVYFAMYGSDFFYKPAELLFK